MVKLVFMVCDVFPDKSGGEQTQTSPFEWIWSGRTSQQGKPLSHLEVR